MKESYKIVVGKDIGRPEASFLVVDRSGRVVGNDANSLLGFPTKKLAQQWKKRLERK